MGYQTLIASLVGVADVITKSLQETVTWYKWTSDNAYSEGSFASGVSLLVVIDYTQKAYRQVDGEVVAQVAAMTFVGPLAAYTPTVTDRRDPVDPRDKFLLPNGRYGTVIGSKGTINPDTGRAYAWEIYLGDGGTAL